MDNTTRTQLIAMQAHCVYCMAPRDSVPSAANCHVGIGGPVCSCHTNKRLCTGVKFTTGDGVDREAAKIAVQVMESLADGYRETDPELSGLYLGIANGHKRVLAHLDRIGAP